MAEDSLTDFSSFLNRPFRPEHFPIEKNNRLHILYAVWLCLSGFYRPQAQWARLWRLPARDSKDAPDRNLASPVHAQARHEAGTPTCVSACVVVTSLLPNLEDIARDRAHY